MTGESKVKEMETEAEKEMIAESKEKNLTRNKTQVPRNLVALKYTPLVSPKCATLPAKEAAAEVAIAAMVGLHRAETTDEAVGRHRAETVAVVVAMAIGRLRGETVAEAVVVAVVVVAAVAAAAMVVAEEVAAESLETMPIAGSGAERTGRTRMRTSRNSPKSRKSASSSFFFFFFFFAGFDVS